jgi:uncharacterized membrane protein YdjX (TVP38/TMEM64 family)
MKSSKFRVKKVIGKGLILVGGAACIWGVALEVFHVDQFLTFAALKAHQADFRAYQTQHEWRTLGLYAAAYALLTAASFPAATGLSLLGGVLFGLWGGTLVALVASTVGALGAFLFARYVFRSFIERRFPAQIQRARDRHGASAPYHLFHLRLNPIMPFFALNLAMGVTRISAWTFTWVSLVGMFPGTLLYVNVGAQLGQIQAIADIVSWRVLLSLLGLGFVPLALRSTLGFLRRYIQSPTV